MIDTHTHLFAEEFDEDRPLVMARAKEAGVKYVLMPNIDDTTVEQMLGVCNEYPDFCYPMIGFHPTSVDEDYLLKVMEMQKLLVPDHPYIAIGEVGMDLYWEKKFKLQQQDAFDRQLKWALEWNLPVVIHCREAFPALFEVLRPYKDTKLTGIIHSFTGTQEEAEDVLGYSGFMIGINGVVTFKKSTLPQILHDVVPLDRIVLETDSPYLAPVPKRGKRNESAYVLHVAEKISNIYELPLSEVDAITTRNAQKVFKKITFV